MYRWYLNMYIISFALRHWSLANYGNKNDLNFCIRYIMYNIYDMWWIKIEKIIYEFR